MTADELKALLSETLKAFAVEVDSKLDALRKELLPVAPEGDKKEELEDASAAVGEALRPLVEAIAGLTKDRDGLGEAIGKTLDRLDNVEKFLTGRQSEEPVEDTDVTKGKEKEPLAEISKAVTAALSGRKVTLV